MFNQQPFRPPSKAAPSAYVSYEIRALPDVGVVAACKDVGCQAWAHGWETTVDETDLSPFGGKARADYIRRESGRTFTERRTGAGLTVFRFEAFQRCFAEHRTKPDLWFRRGGDWRPDPRQEVRRHVRAADWIEDFQEHEGRLADLRQKG